MMIAARNAFLMSGGSSTPTARDYVQDGLIAMWDGIENAGWGTHDASATTWKDLIGTNDFVSLGNCEFDSSAGLITYAVKGGVYGKGCQSSALPADRPLAIEIGFRADAPQYSGDEGLSNIMSMAYARPVPHIQARINGTGLFYSSGGIIYSDLSYAIKGDPICLSLNCDWTTPMSGVGSWSAVINGNSIAVEYMNAYVSTAENQLITLSGRHWSDAWERGFSGRIFYIRLYSRALTAAEVAANYAVDAARFEL